MPTVTGVGGQAEAQSHIFNSGLLCEWWEASQLSRLHCFSGPVPAGSGTQEAAMRMISKP